MFSSAETYFKNQYEGYLFMNFLCNMAKQLTYINEEKAYVSNENGGNIPDTQIVTTGTEVEDAFISHTIDVAENASGTVYRRFGVANHNYYTNDRVAYFVENGNSSQNLPQYLTGWQLRDGTAFNEVGTIVDSSFIETYFPHSSNLNLYAVWGNTKFLRVIISSFDAQITPSGHFITTISEPTSYDEPSLAANNRLSPKFKRVVDYSNISGHLGLKCDGNNVNAAEVGSGHGCPFVVNGSMCPTYFGVKSGNTPTISIQITNSNYIPQYTAGATNSYYGVICQEGLSRDYFTKGETIQLTTLDNTVWTATIPNMSSDKTVFIPLQQKPLITAIVGSQSTTGRVEITDTTTAPSVITNIQKSVMKFPGERCTLWASPLAGNSFEGWYTDSACINAAPNDSNGHTYQSPQYDVDPITENLTLYAKFSQENYTFTYNKKRIV